MNKKVKIQEPQKKQSQKKAGSYNLIKGSKQQLSPICELYQVLCRDTKQIWHAKVFNQDKLKFYGMQKCLEYNYEILTNCKQKQYIITLNEIFTKSNKVFVIQQQYDETLQNLVEKSFPLDDRLAEQILEDVLSGLLELYGEGYFTRSLRPEHIVCVDDVWKIQSFVFDSNLYGFSSEYSWSSNFSSPEDRAKSSQLPEFQFDEQLVWNLGVIALYMFLGPSFPYNTISEDSDIPWTKVQNLVGENLFNFMKRALKTNFKERIKIKELLSQKYFIVNSSENPFNSIDKFYNESVKLKNKQKIVTLKKEDQQKFRILSDEIQRFQYFMEVQKYVQQLNFKNIFDINLLRYLSHRIAFDNLSQLQIEVFNWKKDTEYIIQHTPLKELQYQINNLISTSKTFKNIYFKNIKGEDVSKSEVAEIRNGLEGQFKNNPNYSQVVSLYMKMTGTIYTKLARDCEAKNKTDYQDKIRTLCYYSLGVYLANFYDFQATIVKKQSEFVQNGVIQLIKMVNKSKINDLVVLTQNLIKQKFATSQK